MSFILPFVSILKFLTDVFSVVIYIPLVLDTVAYFLVSYSFNIFQLMCSVNFNSIAGIMQPVVDRLQALIIVYVVYLFGISLIKFLIDPDKAAEGGKKLVINLFIATALFVSYNYIFTVFNELNIAIMGNKFGYKYTILNELFDLDDGVNNGKDDFGLPTRLIFGNDPGDPGGYIAVNLMGAFYRDGDNESKHEYLNGYVVSDDTTTEGAHKYNFFNLINGLDFAKGIAESITESDKTGTISYTPILSLAVAVFVIYSMFTTSLQVGVRMFKLLILQILAPIVIVDVIQNGFGGKFKAYAKKYISVFLEVLIRFLTILIITVFIVKFINHIGDYFPSLQSDEHLITRLIIMIIIIISAYMFAGQVPKFIDEVIGTHIADSSSKGGFGKFVGGMLGAGVGLASGIGTGTLAGAVSGMFGGAAAGSKGKNIADFFKGMSSNSANAKNVGANARMAGGSLAYAGSKVGSFFGRPQGKLEKGKLAAERQTAMDNMIKTLEDNYDENINIAGQDVGLNRDLFKEYAYTDEANDKYGFYKNDLSDDTRDSVDKTMAARKEFEEEQALYNKMYTSGTADEATLKEHSQKMEEARFKYQTLKASTDKKIDTDFNTKLLKAQKEGKIKDKGKNVAEQAVETYNNVASDGYKTEDMIAQKEVVVGKNDDGTPKKKTSNTKTASDHYTTQQDKYTHSASATRHTNSNSRGSGK